MTRESLGSAALFCFAASGLSAFGLGNRLRPDVGINEAFEPLPRIGVKLNVIEWGLLLLRHDSQTRLPKRLTPRAET